MNKYPIVITTIFSPTKAITDFTKLGHPIIAVGDTKTPQDWKHKKCQYLSIDDQSKLFPKFSDLVPTRHYARKNIGYLYAMRTNEAMIETDDDNLPYSFFPNFIEDSIKTDIFTSGKFFNTFNYFYAGKEKIWPRGFPLNYVNKKSSLKRSTKTLSFPLQQSLANDDSDFDAIYRLTNGKEITFKKKIHIGLGKHIYAPINSQNTFWKKEAYLFMYLPVTVKSRVTDIYRGYIAQRLLWEIGTHALFLSPSVYQIRNPHNYLHDFAEEIPIYTEMEKFIDVLENTVLTGSIENKMLQIYQALIKNEFMQKKELAVLKEWIKIATSF